MTGNFMTPDPYGAKIETLNFPNERYEQRFSVHFDYPVYFTRDIFHPENDLLETVLVRRDELRQHRVKVFVDSGIVTSNKYYPQKVRAYFESRADRVKLEGEIEIVPGGARAKSDWQLARHVMGILAESHLCRQSYVLAVGGGSVLDMVGLAASLVHRGVRLIRVPSTILAQNDAGVGVKNGIDDHGMKNFAGTFSPPFAVLNDFGLLRTLPDKHWIGGIAEAFKVAIIKDSELFDFLFRNAEKLSLRDDAAIETTIKRCAILHMDHIKNSGDPFEFGSARPLDFGHWSAHRLEMLSEHRISHGEAVAMGIALDTCYAHSMSFLSKRERDDVIDALERTGLPVWSDVLTSKTSDGNLEILKGLDDFQEHLGGVLNVTLPTAIGHKTEVHEMEIPIIHEVIDYLEQRSAH